MFDQVKELYASLGVDVELALVRCVVAFRADSKRAVRVVQRQFKSDIRTEGVYWEVFRR